MHFSATFITFVSLQKNEEKNYRFYKDYFEKFFLQQDQKVRDKIIWTFELIENLPKVPDIYLKYIYNSDGLFEIRVQVGNDIYRIFSFFDKGQLVIIANGFQKKSQKTPKREIEIALKIKREYEISMLGKNTKNDV